MIKYLFLILLLGCATKYQDDVVPLTHDDDSPMIAGDQVIPLQKRKK